MTQKPTLIPPLFRVKQIIGCDPKTLTHRLAWLKELEGQGKDNFQVNAAINEVFVSMVKQLLKSPLPDEQARGTHIRGLVDANLRVKQENRANILLAPGAKLPQAPADLKPAPVAKLKRQGPHF